MNIDHLTNMNIRINLKSMFLFLFISLVSLNPLKADDKEIPRLTVPSKHEYVYIIEGNNLFIMGKQLNLTDDVFGENKDPFRFHFASIKKRQKKEDNKIDPKKSKQLKENKQKDTTERVNLNAILPRAMGLAFVHPEHLGFTKKKKEQLLELDFVYDYLPMMTKASTSKKGWSYQCQLKFQGQRKHTIHGMTFDRKILEATIKVNVEYDDENKRVSLAKINYSWTISPHLDKYSDYKEPANEQTAKSKRKKLNYKVTIKFDRSQKRPSSYKAKVNHAVNLSTQQLWHYMESTWLKKKLLEKAGGTNRRSILGEDGLVLFALLRAGKNPEDPTVEKLLHTYIDTADDLGFMPKGIVSSELEGINSPSYRARSAYVSAIILMVAEAALSPPAKKERTTKRESTEEIFAKLRGSDKLKKRFLKLGQSCVAHLTQGRGHVWDYDGRRYLYGPGGYSRAQYCVLGLRSAKLLGLNVPENVWLDILDNVGNDIMQTGEDEKLQMEFDSDYFAGYRKRPTVKGMGGWRYMYLDPNKDHAPSRLITLSRPDPCFNMTCSALGNLVMAYSFLPDYPKKKQALVRQHMVNGLAYLQENMDDMYQVADHYAYYSFERVAVFYGIKTVKTKDWHKVMSESLIANQRANGEFGRDAKDSGLRYYGSVVSSAYSLLFLKKATKPLKYKLEFVD